MKSLFRERVLSQQSSQLQGEISLVQVPAFSWLTGLIACIVVFSLIFLYNGSYSRKTLVFGVLQPKEGVIRVLTPQQGLVKRILVEEGDKVEAGQTLVELTMQHFMSENSELNTSLQLEIETILANLERHKEQEVDKERIRLNEVTERITSAQRQLIQIEQQQHTLQMRLDLNKNLVERISQLSDTGYISKMELERQKDLLLSLHQQKQVVQGQQLLIEEQIKQLYSLQQQLPLEHQATLRQLDNQISELRNQKIRLQHEQVTVITAPKAGVVSSILPRIGDFMNSGNIILSILPYGSELEALAYVPTSAVSFINVGQEVRLRLHAFPYERFGTHQGHVLEISQTVLLPEEVIDMQLVEPSYRIRVRLSEQQILAYNRELPLRAGMTLDGDIITERRSLLQWLFDPIYSLKGHL